MTRIRLPYLMMTLSLALAAGTACENPLVEVSETERWWLELEQVTDGSPSAYPRRGTITMRLEANTTTQADPTCADASGSKDVTAFLADVEAFRSRLQPIASGSAEGSWNCHGFAATIRLSDGTTYELRADSPGTPLQHNLVAFDPERSERWTSGARRGLFTLRTLNPDQAEPKVRESHFDLTIHNRDEDSKGVALGRPSSIDNPVFITYADGEPTAGEYAGTFVFAEVPAEDIIAVSWPSHPARRTASIGGGPRSYTVAVQCAAFLGRRPIGAASGCIEEVVCLLGPDHPDHLRFIIEDNGDLVCGEGWLARGVYASLSRAPLFLRAGQTAVSDTVTVNLYEAGTVMVETSHPAISASFGLDLDQLLTVTAAPSAPRIEHGVTITAASRSREDTARVVVPVVVYELSSVVSPATLTIFPESSRTADIQVTGVGVFSPLRFSIESVQGVTFGFSPVTTTGFRSTLTVDVGVVATPGTYDLTVCTTLTWDPLATCHPAPLTVIVPAGNQPPAVNVESPGDGQTFTVGASVTFTGSANDPEDGALTGSSLTWTSDLDGALGTGATFARDDLSMGTHVITLEATDGDGATASASVSIGVIANASPTVTIESPADGQSFTVGESVTFIGSAGDPEDGALTGGSLTWASDVDGVLGTGTTLARNDLSAGTHVITLEATDSQGATGSADLSITIQAGGNGIIRGTVGIPGGGLQGVTVDVTGPVTRTTVTDVVGQYVVDGLPAGTYTVTISNIPGPFVFAVTSQMVTIAAGETATVDFEGTGG